MNTPENTPDIVPVDFADEFDAWLGGAAIAQTSVVIYGKPSLLARYQDLARQRETLEQTLKAEGTLSSPEMEEVDAELETLYDEWMASKSTWYLRGLTADEQDEVKAETPTIDDPAPLVKGANPGQVEWHADLVADVVKQRADANDEENLRLIAKSLVKVEFGDGREIHTVTVDHLRRLRAQLGDLQVSKLAQGVAYATAGDLELPAPFSLRTSQTDRT